MKAKAIDASHVGLKPALDAGLQPRAAEQLLRFYDEPHRYYHNRVHIREMFDAALYDLEQRTLVMLSSSSLAI